LIKDYEDMACHTKTFDLFVRLTLYVLVKKFENNRYTIKRSGLQNHKTLHISSKKILWS
jgi:cytochrome b